MGSKFNDFLVYFTGGEAIKKAMNVVGKGLYDHGTKALKANIFGFGTTDETLTASAFEIAVRELEVSIKEAIKVAEVMGEFPLSVRNKLTNIVGHGQTATAKPADGEKKSSAEIIVMDNMRGARLVKLMSQMTKAQIRKFLKGIDATTTTSVRLREFMNSVAEVLNKLNNSEFAVMAETFRDNQRVKYEEALAENKEKRRLKEEAINRPRNFILKHWLLSSQILLALIIISYKLIALWAKGV